MAMPGWRDSVQAALGASGLGDERAVVAIAVEERARRRVGSGRTAKKLAVLALTVDSASAARLHQFNRNADSVAQVPKLTQMLAQCTRADEVSESAQGFEMQFDSGGAASTVLTWLAETEENRKEFLWCCLRICSLQRRMPASNIDFIDLSLWAQATKLEESCSRAHPLFRQQQAEEGLRGDAGNPSLGGTINLMSTAEEKDVLALLEQSNMSIVDVRKFEAQLSSKLRALEESNIHSILQSVELAEDVCFRLDSAGNAVDELTSWISEINRGLIDIQDGIKEIESQNNKLDTHHTHHEELEATLREVLEQLSMPDEMQRVLLHTDLGAARADEMETCVLPAARRLSMGLQLELKSGMADMAVVRQQKAVFEVLRSKFATRAYDCVKARFEARADVRRQAHIMDTPASHALGDRSVLYEETMANATALLQVLKVLDRGMFDKVIQRYVVRCLSFMNTKDFGDFFSRLRDVTAQYDRQHSKTKVNSRLVAANGLGALQLDELLTVDCGPAEKQQLVGLARAGEWIGNKPTLQCLVASFYYALYCTALHCNREGNFIRSLFSSTANASAALQSLNDLVVVNEHDDIEAEHLMEELYSNQSERLLLPNFVGAVSTAASDPDALQLLEMLTAAYEIADLARVTPAKQHPGSQAEDTAKPTTTHSVLAGGGLFFHNLLSDVIAEIRREFKSWIAGQVKDLARFARTVDPKKCGIIPPIINFVPLVLRVEALVQPMSQERRDSILQRDDSGCGMYTQLVDAIDDCLEAVANANVKYTFLLLFQNYGYFATCLRAVAHIPELCDHVELARRCFESNLDAYAANVLMSPPFHGCAQYFQTVIASKVELPEVQFQSAFSKPNVQKVLKPMTRKAVQAAISEIARTIRRQLATPPATTAGIGEPGSPGGANAAFSVEAVWDRVSQTLGAQWQEWQRLCEMCYGSGIALALSAEQVMSLMDEEASQMARAAANSAVGVAGTARVVAASKAASQWRKSAHQTERLATDERAERTSKTSRMSV
eukprot:COSAG02_NODE_525_length_20713_cov_5.808286_4_plen_1010_part_00